MFIILRWVGIFFCLTQSAMFSGLNLAFFSLTRLQLEIEAEHSTNEKAKKVLDMRKDSNFLLCTILWGNVGINVLLTLLTNSVLSGLMAFIFSTFLITFFGEIIPQAYFSRYSLKMASLLAPILKIYQVVLFPFAKTTALLLDLLLGKEAINYFAEKNIKIFLRRHIQDDTTDIGHIEGTGAINFLSIDDLKVVEEGEEVNPESVIKLPSKNGTIIFPEYTNNADDDFIININKSGEKWVIITDDNDVPEYVLDADSFIRSTLFSNTRKDILKYCHIPIIFEDQNTKLDAIIKSLKGNIKKHQDIPINKDIVLFWNKDKKRIITGADILGRLLKGI